eukprot:s8595_g1.t1
MRHASLCASQRPVFQEDSMFQEDSTLLGLLSQAGAVSHFGCAVFPYCLIVWVSIAWTRSAAKHVRDARCMAGRLITNRAIIQVSGWIRPPVASAHAIPPSAASSLRPVAAPVCFLQCSYGGCFRAVRSGHLFVSRPTTGRRAKLFPDARCMAGRLITLITNRAIIQVSGWFRPRSAHDRFIGVQNNKRLALVFSHHAHQSSSKQANHSAACIRCQDLVHGARMAVSNTLRPVQAAPKRQAVLQSFRCPSWMWAPPGVAEPLPKVGMSRPSSWPSAAFMLGVHGAARVAWRVVRDVPVGLQAAVEANYAEINPVEETLRLAQAPFVVMIRKLLPLLPSQALQGRQVRLDLVLVGQSHGGVIAHSLAQSLESAGFVVRGIVAADTLGLPRQVEMSSPRFDPQALARHRSPYHWHLSSPKLNMMAPEVPRRSRAVASTPASVYI